MRAAHLRSLPLLLALALLPRTAAAAERWAPLGPDGGEIWSLAADPDAPGTVYAGTRDGGVWQSRDGGGHWVPTAAGLGSGEVSALAVSPGRVWAGTSRGLFVLTDDAFAWRQLGPPGPAQCLAVDPAHPDRIWAGTPTGEVLASDDGGEHWVLRLDLGFPITAVAVAPTPPLTVYAAGGDGVFRSADAGASWRQIVPDSGSSGDGPRGGFALAFAPTDADVLYILSAGSSTMWKTTDAGATWGSVLDYAYSLHGVLLVLPGILLTGNDRALVRSDDDGATWRQEYLGLTPFSLAADPAEPAGAWLGTGGQGVLRSLDGGRTWMPSRRGLSASDIQAFAFDPFRPRTLFAETTGLGLYRSADGGASWSRLGTPGPRTRLDIFSLAADPHQPGTLYAGTTRGVSVSRDRGAHWQPVLNDPLGIWGVTVDPHRAGTIYAAGNVLRRSRDGGRTWKAFHLATAQTGRILFSPWDPETLYGEAGSQVLERSTDGGQTWKQVFDNAQIVTFVRQIPGLLVAADRDGEIWKSRDGGTAWERTAQGVGSGAFPLALLADPSDPAILYLGTDSNSVWRSRDQGATWEPFSSGLMAPRITCLEADPHDPHRLIACTQGGGLEEIRLDS